MFYMHVKSCIFFFNIDIVLMISVASVYRCVNLLFFVFVFFKSPVCSEKKNYFKFLKNNTVFFISS